MHAQLSLWEERTAGDARPVWSTLDDAQRAEVIAALGRLIIKLAIAADGKEIRHE